MQEEKVDFFFFFCKLQHDSGLWENKLCKWSHDVAWSHFAKMQDIRQDDGEAGTSFIAANFKILITSLYDVRSDLLEWRF